MYVELGWVVIELLPSGGLSWSGGGERVWSQSPAGGWGRGRGGGLGLVVDVLVDGVCVGESGVGGSESVVAWSVVGLGRWLVLGVWRCVWSSRRARW